MGCARACPICFLRKAPGVRGGGTARASVCAAQSDGFAIIANLDKAAMRNGTLINGLVFESNTTNASFKKGWRLANQSDIPTPEDIVRYGQAGLERRGAVELQSGICIWAIANRSVVTDALEEVLSVNGKSFKFTDFDKYSLSNVENGSPKMW
jgi:hypothetical protein